MRGEAPDARGAFSGSLAPLFKALAAVGDRTLGGDRCLLYMGHSTKIRREKRASRKSASLAKSLAPEDVRAGDFVAVLDEVCELPSFLWDDCGTTAREEVVRVRYLPDGDAAPMKVRGVCLPYVLVKQPCGGKRTLDVRKSRLARLDRRYARAAWKAYKKRPAKSDCP